MPLSVGRSFIRWDDCLFGRSVGLSRFLKKAGSYTSMLLSDHLFFMYMSKTSLSNTWFKSFSIQIIFVSSQHYLINIHNSSFFIIIPVVFVSHQPYPLPSNPPLPPSAGERRHARRLCLGSGRRFDLGARRRLQRPPAFHAPKVKLWLKEGGGRWGGGEEGGGIGVEGRGGNDSLKGQHLSGTAWRVEERIHYTIDWFN